MKCLISIFIFLLFCNKTYSQELHYRTLSTEDGLPSNIIHSLSSDKKGFIWFGTQNGLVRWDGRYFKTYTIEDGLPNNEILGVYEDKKGRIWIATFSNELCYLENNTIYTQKNDPKLKNIVTTTGQSIQEVQNKILVFSTTGTIGITPILNLNDLSLFRIDSTINCGGHLVEYNHRIYGINSDFICELDLLDKTITSIYPSLVKLNAGICQTYFDKFKTISFQKVYQNKALTNYILNSYLFPKYSIIKELNRETEYRLFEHHNMLFVVHLADFKFYPSNPVYKINNLATKTIFNFQNQLYYLVGSQIYNLKNERVGSLPEKSGLNYNMDKISSNKYIITNNNHVYGLDQNLNSIPISKSYGLNFKHSFYHKNTNQYFIGTGTDFFLKNKNGVKPLKKMRTYCSFLDSRDRLWYSGVTELFYQDKFTGHLYSEKKFNLSANVKLFINEIKEDKYGNIFFTTNDGIYIYNSNTKTKYHLDKSNYLTTNECSKLIFDDTDHSFWITTPNGLNHIKYSINNQKLSFEVVNKFFKTDGLNSSEINDISILGDSVWVATPKGLNLILDKNYKPKTEIIPIHINQIKVNDRWMNFKSNMCFNSDETNLIFNFSAIYYLRRDRLKTYYRLIKDKDTSTYEADDNLIRLNSLNPGHYTIEIYAYDQDYPYIKSAIKREQFSILKPYYLKWWFITMIFLIILAFFLSIFWYRNKLKLEKLRAESNMNKYRLQGLQNQMNPHFIFNSMSTIQNLILNNDSEHAMDFISDFSALMRTMLNNARNEEISLENELKFIKNYIDLEQTRYQNSFEVQYQINIPEDELEEIQIPTMMIQPILENAIKHGVSNLKNRKGVIVINLSLIEQHKYLKISISDNGIGNTSEANISSKPQSTAILVIQERLKLYEKDKRQGHYRFEFLSKGAQVELVLPI